MHAGKRFGGRYELTVPLGTGTMGSVWQAVDRELDRRVAVKIALPERSATSRAERRARFEREARAAARLDHPAITTVHDLGVDEDGTLWMVMQVVEGATLADLLAERGEPFGTQEAAAVAAQLCGGLAVAHRAGLVHRDLKPDNIMVRKDGQVKILDFGLVKLMGDVLARLTATGEGVGNLLCASPELLGGESDLDGRSDLYALGCLLHHMLTGAPPFPPEPPVLLAGRHLHEPPPTPADCGVVVPPSLQELVGRLLAKDRGERPADAAEVYRLLVPHLPGPERAGSAGGRDRPEDARRPFLIPSGPYPMDGRISAGG
ncbi:serine/threonine-protein kinase [Streptomyces sp. NPDC058726]|uniref:serine/threonine-protein kinase n=1 Tax=Streptomyces sp. NPDC058726 TaxID=3346611 RepID=UPI0036CA493A